MQLKPIPIISRAVSSSLPISVDWKGLEPDDAIGDLNERYLDDFKEINSVAALAYIIYCLEWVYHFLRHHFKTAEVTNFEQFIIANWVWLCDLPRKLPPYYDLTVVDVSHKRPTNVVAVEFVISSIWDGVLAIPNQETYIFAGLATQICDYVLPQESGFQKWREIILHRLKEKFPLGKTNPSLIQISRRFFDTDIGLDNVDHEADCETLLGERDFEVNPYLPLTVPDPE